MATIFKCILLNENICALHEIARQFVPKGQIDSKSTLIQLMAWYQQATSH